MSTFYDICLPHVKISMLCGNLISTLFVTDGDDAYVDDIMQEFKTAKRFVKSF